MIGQLVSAVGQPLILATPATLAALWFHPSESALATTLGSVLGYLGIAISFLAGLWLLYLSFFSSMFRHESFIFSLLRTCFFSLFDISWYDLLYVSHSFSFALVLMAFTFNLFVSSFTGHIFADSPAGISNLLLFHFIFSVICLIVVFIAFVPNRGMPIRPPHIAALRAERHEIPLFDIFRSALSVRLEFHLFSTSLNHERIENVLDLKSLYMFLSEYTSVLFFSYLTYL